MAACVMCLSSLAVVGSSSGFHRRRAPGGVVSSSSIFGRSMISRGLSAGSRTSFVGCGRNVVCEVAVKVGDAHSSGEQDTTVGGVQPGAKIRVKVPLTVYHVLKSPNLNIQGLEGEVKDVLKVFKGKTISATLPYKVQFVIEVDGKPVKFFAHFKDDEIEVVE